MIHNKDSLGNMDTPVRGYLVFTLASLHLWGNVKFQYLQTPVLSLLVFSSWEG